MPYQDTNDLPDNVKPVLPAHAQAIYKEAFNSARNNTGILKTDAVTTAGRRRRTRWPGRRSSKAIARATMSIGTKSNALWPDKIAQTLC